MSNETNVVDFLNFNPEEVQAPTRESRFITRIPDKDKALIVKIVPNPRFSNGRTWFQPFSQFTFVAGPNPDKDKRNKTCLSFFDEPSPERDAFWEYYKELENLKKLGKGNSVEAAKLQAMVDKFKPKDGGWLLVIEPNSPVIRAVKAPITVIQCLTGKEATKYRPEIKSLIKEMASEGLSPFDIKKNKPKLGWVKIYKTGEGLSTRYTVEPVKHEVAVEDKNGKKFKVWEHTELDVHEKFLTGQVTLDDFPDVVEYERKHAWTLDECKEYVKSLGTKVPDRFMKKDGNGGRTDETDEATKTVNSLDSLPSMDSLLPDQPQAKEVSSDEIPF